MSAPSVSQAPATPSSQQANCCLSPKAKKMLLTAIIVIGVVGAIFGASMIVSVAFNIPLITSLEIVLGVVDGAVFLYFLAQWANEQAEKACKTVQIQVSAEHPECSITPPTAS